MEFTPSSSLPSAEEEKISHVMRDLIISRAEGRNIDNSVSLDKIFQKLKLFKVDKMKKTNGSMPSSSGSVQSTPTKNSSSSSSSAPSSTPPPYSSSSSQLAFNACYEEEFSSFLSCASNEGIDSQLALLLYLLTFTKSILLNFMQDKLMKLFVLSSKKLILDIVSLSIQQEETLTQALNSFISIEEPVSKISDLLSTAIPLMSVGTPASSPLPTSASVSASAPTSAPSLSQFYISAPISLQDLVSSVQKEKEDTEEPGTSSGKESSKKALTTLNFLKCFCSSFFFLLENCPALLSLSPDRGLLERFFDTLMKLDLSRYALRLIQFYPDYFSPTFLITARDVLLDKNDPGIVSSAYVSVSQVRNSLKNHNPSSHSLSSSSSNSFMPEDMLKPEVIAMISRGLRARREKKEKRDDSSSLISIQHSAFKKLTDDYASLLLSLERSTSNRALLDLVIHAPSATSLTLSEAKDLNFKAKLKGYVKKNKWFIASSFCRDQKSNLHLFDILQECGYYLEAKQLYDSKPFIADQRAPVDPNLIASRMEYINSAYLRYPDIPIDIVVDAEGVEKMARLMVVSLEQTFETYPTEHLGHFYGQDVSLEDFFAYTDRGCVNFSQETAASTTLPYRQIVGIDAEWPFDSQRGASILQISISNHVFILDLLRIGRGEKAEHDLNMTSRFLNNLFRDPSILKITFDFYLSDLKMIGMSCNNYYIDCVKVVNSMVDLKKVIKDPIANFNSVQEREKSNALSNLVNRFLGKPLNKDQQVSHWDLRPLTPSQVSYAALDSHVLLAVLDVLLLERGSSGTLSLALDVYKAGETIEKNMAEIQKTNSSPTASRRP